MPNMKFGLGAIESFPGKRSHPGGTNPTRTRRDAGGDLSELGTSASNQMLPATPKSNFSEAFFPVILFRRCAKISRFDASLADSPSKNILHSLREHAVLKALASIDASQSFAASVKTAAVARIASKSWSAMLMSIGEFFQQPRTPATRSLVGANPTRYCSGVPNAACSRI